MSLLFLLLRLLQLNDNQIYNIRKLNCRESNKYSVYLAHSFLSDAVYHANTHTYLRTRARTNKMDYRQISGTANGFKTNRL